MPTQLASKHISESPPALVKGVPAQRIPRDHQTVVLVGRYAPNLLMIHCPCVNVVAQMPHKWIYAPTDASIIEQHMLPFFVVIFAVHHFHVLGGSIGT